MMQELELLANTAAFAEDRTGNVASQTFQSRQTLAFFRSLKKIIRQAYSVDETPTSVAVTPTPMVYTAADRMSLHIVGGTVTGLSFRRGTTTLTLSIASAGQFVNLNPGDQAIISYSAAPTLTAVPR